MRWIVDRIEDTIAILENETTQERKEIDISKLPSSIHEGSILSYHNELYQLCLKDEERKRKEIEARFKNLRSNH